MAEVDDLEAPIRGFLGRSLDQDRLRSLLIGDSYDAQLMSEVAEQGWFALSMPSASDGLDLPFATLGRVMRTVGEHLLPGPVLENLVVPSFLARELGPETLPILTHAADSGRPIAVIDAFGGSSSSPTDNPLRLVGGFLTGVGELVRFGAHASHFAVMVPTEEGDEQLCLVDAEAPGVSVEHQDGNDPLSCFAVVRFNDVRPIAAIGGNIGSGHSASRLRGWLRLVAGCELSGIAQHAFESTHVYVTQRTQFGQTIGSFQAVQHILAEMYARVQSLTNLCNAALVDAEESKGEFPFDVALTGATVKAWAGEVARLVCEDAIQIHGGIGFTFDLDLHWYYKRALCLGVYLGDQLDLESELGRTLLDAEMRKSLSSVRAE